MPKKPKQIHVVTRMPKGIRVLLQPHDIDPLREMLMCYVQETTPELRKLDASARVNYYLMLDLFARVQKRFAVITPQRTNYITLSHAESLAMHTLIKDRHINAVGVYGGMVLLQTLFINLDKLIA